MRPHSILGITRNASVPEIKKAYARLLKQNRPDEDPVAFQSLQQAYEECLAITRREESKTADARNEFFSSTIVIDSSDADAAPNAPPTPSAPSTPQRPVPKPEPWVDIHAILDEMLQVAQWQWAGLRHWLIANPKLYSLDVKHQVADAISEYLMRNRTRMKPDSFQVLYEFFDLNPIANPRLQTGHQFLQLWQQARDDEQYEASVARLRTSKGKFFGGVIFEELFGSPDRLRRFLILLLPLLTMQLRSVLDELLKLSQPHTLNKLTPGVFDYWSRVLDRRRLDWRRILAVAANFLFFFAAITGTTGVLVDMDLPTMVSVTFNFTGIAMAVWFIFAIGIMVRFRYRQWRTNKFGAAEPQPGESIFGDAISTLGLASAFISLLYCGLAAVGVIEEFALTVSLLFFGIAWCVLVFGDGWIRWDALIFLALMQKFMISIGMDNATTATYLLPPTIALFGSLGALMLIAFDWFHARRKKLSLPASRREYNWLALGVGIAILFTLPLTG